jgi:hypothetical protein
MQEVKLRCIYVTIESVDSSDQLESHNDYSRTFSNDIAELTRGEGEVCATLPEPNEGNIVRHISTMENTDASG